MEADHGTKRSVVYYSRPVMGLCYIGDRSGCGRVLHRIRGVLKCEADQATVEMKLPSA